MKKLIFAIGIILILCMTGCGSSKQNITIEQPVENSVKKAAVTETADVPQTQDSEISAETETAANDTIVVYFSREGEQYNVGVIDKGNTAIIADIIAEEKNADIFRLYPAVDNYPVTYKELTDYAKKEQAENARPELLGTIDNWEEYDTVYLGYPIWWSDMPMIVYSFIESYDMSGKTVIPFCIHEGSGISGTDGKLKQILPDSTVLDGLAVQGKTAQKNDDSVKQTVKDWLADK
ncbi:MAG: flavodoxin [Firmicutes bacterium]|nr:flavodoxin [Bacillota bacterium]